MGYEISGQPDAAVWVQIEIDNELDQNRKEHHVLAEDDAGAVEGRSKCVGICVNLSAITCVGCCSDPVPIFGSPHLARYSREDENDLEITKGLSEQPERG